jgi:glycosyltransferase involved in cell wall biosynthesis
LLPNKKPKLLFLVTEDYYFWSHRLLIAKAAQQAGFEVFIATHIQEYGERLKREGCQVFPTFFSRDNKNLARQFLALVQLIGIFRRVRPDIVHNVALKAIVFGSIAAWFARVPKVINLVAGLGIVFTDDSKKYRFFSQLGCLMARILFQRQNTLVVTQNSDDMCEIKHMAPKASFRLIRGSGVNTGDYSPQGEPSNSTIQVTLVGRMLWHKGIREFVEAARLVKQQQASVIFRLVGGLDFGNGAHISESQLLEWQSSGLIQWLGHQENIAKIWTQSHIAVLPSYREGLPKSLLEAAACGKPIVAADTPGCREIVVDGYNGFLVPPKNSEALANAILRLVIDPDLRTRMGKNSRQLVCEQFSDEKVIEQTLGIYREAMV